MGTEASGTGYWQDLLNRAMEGDADAFGALWQEYLSPKRLYPYALQLLGNSYDAEDVVQSMFAYLFERSYYRKIKKRSLNSFEGYVRKMTYNMYVNHLRKQKQTYFIITNQTLEQLKLARVSDDLLKQLEDIQQQGPVGREKFLDLLATLIGNGLTDTLEALILRYSRYERKRWRPLSTEIIQQHLSRNTVQEDIEQSEIERIFYDETRSELTEDEWNVLYHKHCTKDFSFRKFSEQTGIPLMTLYSQYHKAREKILKNRKLRTYKIS